MKAGKVPQVLAIALWIVLLPHTGVAQTADAWFDITTSGAKCDGTTNDTSAIQAALTAAEAVAGTVFSPPGKTCLITTQLKMDGYVGVKVIGGFGGNPFAGNLQSTWKFSGPCGPSGAACLLMRSAQAVSFHNIQLSFTNATAGPMVDLEHNGSTGSDSSLISFDGVAFSGPGSGIGPIVLDQNTDSVSFEGWTSFSHASVFVEGPSDNANGFSDKTVFDHVNFENPGTAAIQNASINWTISNSIFQIFLPGSTCTPALQYVNGYANEQTLLVIGNVVNSTGGNCINTFSVFSLPAASGNLGGATFLSNLFISGTAAGTQTEISAGNNQSVTATGNAFNHIGTALSVGTDVFVDIGPNVYSDVTTQIRGTPFAGGALLSGGDSVVYAGLTVGPGGAITSSGSGGIMGSIVASGTTFMSTAPIAAGTCGSPVMVVASGVEPTDAISHSFGSPVGANPGVLIVQSWPASGTVNFAYCNPTAGSVTPVSTPVNWRVVR